MSVAQRPTPRGVGGQERAAGAMAEEKAERIAALMREHGAVLLQCSVPLVPHADLDRIGARLEFQSALAKLSSPMTTIISILQRQSTRTLCEAVVGGW